MHINTNWQWKALSGVVWAFSPWMHFALTWNGQATQEQPSISARSPVTETSGEEQVTQHRELNTQSAVSAELIVRLSLMFSIEGDSRAARCKGRAVWPPGWRWANDGLWGNWKPQWLFLLRWWTQQGSWCHSSCWQGLELVLRALVEEGWDCILKNMSRHTVLSSDQFSHRFD